MPKNHKCGSMFPTLGRQAFESFNIDDTSDDEDLSDIKLRNFHIISDGQYDGQDEYEKGEDN